MKKIFAIVILTIISAFWLACSNDAEKATLNVKLTDAPITLSNGEVVEQVNVVLKRIDLVKKGSGEENSTTAKDGDGVITVLETDMAVNLLDYQDGAELLLKSVELDAGTYLQLRLIVDVENSTIKFADDDTLYTLKIPSGSTSGIKIKGNAHNPLFTIGEGDEADLVFDFDASQSVGVHLTNKNEYTLRPVIKEVKFRNTVVAGLDSEEVAPAE